MRRWKTRTSSRQGSATRIPAAATSVNGGMPPAVPMTWIWLIRRVIVTALRSPRTTANRNSFQVPIRTRMAAAAMPGRAAGIVTRNSVPEARAAVHPGRRLEAPRHVLEDVPQQPDDQRQPERDVDEDQGGHRVLEPQPLEQHEDRDRQHDRRDHLGEDQDAQEQPLAGHLEPGERDRRRGRR